MNNTLLAIPDWFWKTIDSSKPDLKKLESRLEAIDIETLENYYGFYLAAAHSLCEPWNGPYIDKDIDHLSEDSTKDLTEWVVSQGYDYWSSIANKEDEEREEALRKAFWEEDKAGELPHLVKWTYDTVNPAYKGYCSPLGLAMAIYEHKFKRDIYDYEEEIFDRIDKLLN